MPKRCDWCGTDELYVAYHDEEWGVPVYDDHTLFEFLVLEGAQAGLAWITVLRKREGYRALFDDFDAQKIARYTDRKLDKILTDARIIRNRLKVYGARQNARAFLEVQAEWGSFSDYMWNFVDGKPIQNSRRRMRDVPATTPLSDHQRLALFEATLRWEQHAIVEPLFSSAELPRWLRVCLYWMPMRLASGWVVYRNFLDPAARIAATLQSYRRAEAIGWAIIEARAAKALREAG